MSQTCSSIIAAVAEQKNEVFNSNLFPNPFSKTSEVSFNKDVRNASLIIYNLFGQRIKIFEHINGSQTVINREGMTDGIYLYEVVGMNDRIAYGKLVVN